ncbi:hypothetical protein SS1G_03032 [Sclerotinia sclerotiorum 1980 UF-70]|uniref:Uncharacterized protein n=1 Tax=Sclerotinia sclerotiorum (strain ATCC 18683 / 1980 / Ss-1) TaxID=665079 RepID=A7ECJ3_SCLS1|nr:hypothetical protein SS1G_03032 [Sclerotinia sclerotiorum 1980 UF-70]EDO00172.1 hypothetical protein SS1G_03032 [Sclerotinia sclerotiorum 1980 UF-70]
MAQAYENKSAVTIVTHYLSLCLTPSYKPSREPRALPRDLDGKPRNTELKIRLTWFISERAISPSGPLLPQFISFNFNTRFINKILWNRIIKKVEYF